LRLSTWKNVCKTATKTQNVCAFFRIHPVVLNNNRTKAAKDIFMLDLNRVVATTACKRVCSSNYCFCWLNYINVWQRQSLWSFDRSVWIADAVGHSMLHIKLKDPFSFEITTLLFCHLNKLFVLVIKIYYVTISPGRTFCFL